jgi:hypothetical protein
MSCVDFVAITTRTSETKEVINVLKEARDTWLEANIGCEITKVELINSPYGRSLNEFIMIIHYSKP